MHQIKSILAAVGILAAGALSASANVSGPFTTTTPIGPVQTDISNVALAFPEFNPALGTLTAVVLDISSTLTTAIQIQNLASSNSSGNVDTRLQITVEDTGMHLGPDPILQYTTSSFNYTLGAGGSTNSGMLMANGNTGNVSHSTAAVLLEFTGTGTFTNFVTTHTDTQLSNTGGNTTSSQITTASITGTVTYDYTPATVPEPTTMVAGALTLLPFCGGALRKLRKNTAA